MAQTVVANSNQTTLEAVAPHYWEQACKELMKNDRIMRKLIPKFGTGFLMTRGDPFVTLARSIVCLLYTSPSPRDRTRSRMPSSA